MAIDWFATVSAAGELAKTAAQDVPIALANERMTLDEASKLHRTVEMRAQECDAMIAEMQDDDDVNEDLLEAADHLQNMWDSLAVACASKVRELQGLPPIPLFDDDDEDED